MTWPTAVIENARLGASALFLGVASLVMAFALVRGSRPLRRGVAIAVLAALAIVAGGQIVSPGLDSPFWLPGEPYLVLVFAITAAAGVASRRAWGFWLTLGAGIGGVASSCWWLLDGLVIYSGNWGSVWMAYDVLMLAGSALLVAGVGGAMRDRLATRPAALMRLRGPRGTLLRAGVFLTLAAVPTLATLALGLPWHTDLLLEQGLALLAAALVAAGAILVIRGHTVGMLMTCSGAFAVVQLVAGYTAAYYDWPVLAAAPLGAALELAAIAGPAWRRLRG